MVRLVSGGPVGSVGGGQLGEWGEAPRANGSGGEVGHAECGRALASARRSGPSRAFFLSCARAGVSIGSPRNCASLPPRPAPRQQHLAARGEGRPGPREFEMPHLMKQARLEQRVKSAVASTGGSGLFSAQGAGRKRAPAGSTAFSRGTGREPRCSDLGVSCCRAPERQQAVVLLLVTAAAAMTACMALGRDGHAHQAEAPERERSSRRQRPCA